MILPTKEECFELWDEFAVPANVRNHIKKVTDIAVFLAKKLKEKGQDVNIELVEKSGLLHDLVRTCNFENIKDEFLAEKPSEKELKVWKELKEKYGSMHHGDAASEVLKHKYPELAKVISKHRYGLIGKKDGPQTWEEKLINYSDKRVAHDKIVSIQGRHDEANTRKEHQKTIAIDNRFSELEKLEQEIFSKLDFKPDELEKEMSK